MLTTALMQLRGIVALKSVGGRTSGGANGCGFGRPSSATSLQGSIGAILRYTARPRDACGVCAHMLWSHCLWALDTSQSTFSFFFICTRTALTPATSAPGLDSPLPHLHRDCSHPCHICTGTGLTPATSALGVGSPQVHGNVLDALPRLLLHGRWREAGQRRTLLDHRTRR